MASQFPEPVAVIRHIDPVYRARGGFVYRTTIRLNNGRAVSFYEACRDGRATICETRALAFEVLRNG